MSDTPNKHEQHK